MDDLLSTLATRLNATERRDGRHHADCPYCGKEAKRAQTHFSFCDKGYSCWVCGEQGGLRKLARYLELTPDLPITPARAQEPPKPRQWQLAPERWLAGYLEAPTRLQDWQSYKPLSIDTIARYRLGVGVLPSSRCRMRRLIVPVFVAGDVVALHGRAYLPGDDDARWLTAGGSRKDVLFNADALRPGADVIIAENMVDALLAQEAEPNVVGVAGGGVAWRDTWTQQIVASRPRRVLVWLDHDLAGNGSRYHAAELLATWRERNPQARHTPAPRGPQIANALLSAGVRASVYQWPRGTPLKADLGWALAQEMSGGTHDE